MSIKLCFNNEIHRVPKLPVSFNALIDTVKTIFKDSIPTHYALQYDDADGDRIMMTTEEDFKSMIESERPSSTRSVKVHVVSVEPESSILSKQQESVEVIQKEEKILEPILQKEETISFQNQGSKTEVQEISIQKEEIIPEKVNGLSTLNKEELRDVVTELIYENIPSIALLVKDLLTENPSTEPKVTNASSTTTSSTKPKVVHERVTCDGCGVHPIEGVRYKCSTCDDFDYCEKCEATVNHPHPFLKIKDANTRVQDVFIDGGQIPRFPPFGHFRPPFGFGGPRGGCPFKGGCKRSEGTDNKGSEGCDPKMFHPFAKLAADYYKNLPQEFKEELNSTFGGLPETILSKFESQTKPEEQKVEETKPQPKEEQTPVIDAQFIKEISTVPSKIGLKDLVIYKTISLKNTGSVEWPKSVFLTSVGKVKGQKTNLVSVGPGKEISAILVIDSPAVAGKHVATWSLAYLNEKNETVFIGKPFDVEFVIDAPEEPKVQETAQPKVEEPKKEYPEKVMSKASLMKDLFPDVDLKNLLEFINQNANLSIEELIDNYLIYN